MTAARACLFALFALFALLAGLAPAGATELAQLGTYNELRDPREDMRKLVQRISAFAREERRDFAIVARGGLALLVKQDPMTPERQFPSQTYIRSIHGVMQDGLFYGVPEIDKPTTPERRKAASAYLDIAKANGLTVLVVDYATKPATIDAARQAIARAGFVPFVAPARGLGLSRLPAYPPRPHAENGGSVLSLQGIRNFALLHDSAAFGRQDEFALTLHGTNYDLLVVDVFHAPGEPLSKQAIETLKYKKAGARRLVFAYCDIGRAAAYDYYWRPDWREGSPGWIEAPTPDDPERHFVEYWQPEWQRILVGSPDSYIYGLIAKGFDGVVLEGLDAYRYFEGGLEAVEGEL